ncbi:hypothetical protein AWB79_06583 [Caballeronia hypogeia]|uniref:Uncharacterized protein n=1 Tax=Caballeronia hypogeia TaxID=1777140 RepID=A0A158D7R6_9BURK|nr:hypothetical protein [Caballeronia hypogeia]SAK90523.1 hypothetical protein AWB79_06583 [Caballeronia hypogeia]
MKIEAAPIAAAALLADDAERDAESAEAAPVAEQLSYDDLLPYLLLPMAGAY